MIFMENFVSSWHFLCPIKLQSKTVQKIYPQREKYSVAERRGGMAPLPVLEKENFSKSSQKQIEVF